jgi:hypothetical protein
MAKRQRENGEVSFNDAMSALRAWYYSEVREWAEDFDKRLEEGEFDSVDNFNDCFHEETDGAGIIIYTAQARAALLASDNDDAYFEEFGDEMPMQGGQPHWEAVALVAFQRDIQETMSNDPNDDEWYEEEDEDD